MIACNRVRKWIRYHPFYRTLIEKGVTEYALIYKQGMVSHTIHRMKHGKPIITTLNTLCESLDCRMEDILEYVPDGESFSTRHWQRNSS